MIFTVKTYLNFHGVTPAKIFRVGRICRDYLSSERPMPVLTAGIRLQAFIMIWVFARPNRRAGRPSSFDE